MPLVWLTVACNLLNSCCDRTSDLSQSVQQSVVKKLHDRHERDKPVECECLALLARLTAGRGLCSLERLCEVQERVARDAV